MVIDGRILEWFERERGIKPETLAAFKVRQEDDKLIFPYPNGEKVRRDPTKQYNDGRRGFFFTAGKKPELFGHVEPDKKIAFLVEGETDTLRLWQAFSEEDFLSQPTVLGLSGIETWQPHFASYFDHADTVFVILDNDEDYNVKARVDAVWKQIRSDLGPKKARRVFLPVGVKDICEFFERYDLESLRTLVGRKSQSQLQFKGLDLTAEPPPMDWLVSEIICSGDVTLLMGDPGLGKSWLSMALAVAIAGDGDNSWLSYPVLKRGRVMYVDEENPEDIIFHRFKKLGLTSEQARNIHYLYRPGIWLNKDPDSLLEEALEYQPELIVIDSLSRVHSEDENSAGAMANVFREGITPLARDTGAAVVVIHHSNKGDTNNSYQRARGSGDISAVVDAALDVRGTDVPGRFTVSLYKSRRRLGGQIIPVQITDKPDGGVRLVASDPNALPF